MKTWPILGALILLCTGLSALPSAGTDLHVYSGSLESLGGWWNQKDDQQVRWWFRPSGPSAAWLRWGEWQLGPLAPGSTTLGKRVWHPSNELSSGHWGLAWDGRPWGLWALQTPESFAVGTQCTAQAAFSSWSVGGERTWSTTWFVPEEGPWTDRYHLGWGLEVGDWSASTVGRLVVPAAKESVFVPEVRARFERRGTSVQFEASTPRRASGEVSVLGWTAGARVGDDSPEGRLLGGWKSSVLGILGWYDWHRGPGLRSWVEPTWEASQVKLSFWLQGGETAEARISAELASEVRNRGWSFAWDLLLADVLPAQTVSAVWKDSAFEVKARWKTKGLRWGWIGPDQSFDLWIRLPLPATVDQAQSPT